MAFTPEERLWTSLQCLSMGQRAECLNAIVAWLLAKKLSSKDEISFNRDEVYVITQVLIRLWCWFITPTEF